MLTVAAFSTKRETFSAKNLDLGHYLGFAHWEVLSIQRLGTDTSTLLTFVIAAKKGVLPTNARSSPNNLELGQASKQPLAQPQGWPNIRWHRICLLLEPDFEPVQG